MKFIVLKTKDGESKEEIAFCCGTLRVSRQGFYQYLANKNRPWKYQRLADAILEILSEDECNDTYGRIRMYQALTLRQPENVEIPSERTVYRIMEEIGISHPPKRKPNGITKADREARKSDDLLKRDFHTEKPLTKCVTDITEMKGSDGKLICTPSRGQRKNIKFFRPAAKRCWPLFMQQGTTCVFPLVSARLSYAALVWCCNNGCSTQSFARVPVCW